MTRRYCLALDLKDDPQLIAENEAHHRRVWPEVLGSLEPSGIVSMEIYRLENAARHGDGGRRDLHLRTEGRRRRGESDGAGLGNADVELPAGDSGRRCRREVAADRPHLRLPPSPGAGNAAAA